MNRIIFLFLWVANYAVGMEQKEQKIPLHIVLPLILNHKASLFNDFLQENRPIYAHELDDTYWALHRAKPYVALLHDGKTEHNFAMQRVLWSINNARNKLLLALAESYKKNYWPVLAPNFFLEEEIKAGCLFHFKKPETFENDPLDIENPLLRDIFMGVPPSLNSE